MVWQYIDYCGMRDNYADNLCADGKLCAFKNAF